MKVLYSDEIPKFSNKIQNYFLLIQSLWPLRYHFQRCLPNILLIVVIETLHLPHHRHRIYAALQRRRLECVIITAEVPVEYKATKTTSLTNNFDGVIMNLVLSTAVMVIPVSKPVFVRAAGDRASTIKVIYFVSGD